MPDENSKNRPKSPGAKSYFEALRRVFDLQAQVLTNALPHYGERGRNDEERFRAFLSNTLPRKYGVGTGFVIASDDRTSKQVDVVIFDELQNAPLHREMAAFVFPVEMVYATIEVKGRIRPKLLSGCLGNIESVRSLTSSKVYGVPAVMAVEGKPGKGKAVTLQMPDSTAPRAFVVAYDAAGWKDVTAFANSWAAALGGRGAHLHGVLVIRKNWYIAQHTYQDRVRLSVYEGDALLRFHDKLRRSIEGFRMAPAYLDPYYNLEAKALPDVVATIDVPRVAPTATPKKAAPRKKRPAGKGRNRV